MPDLKISQLPGAASALGTDEFAINQGGSSKKVTTAQLATYLDTLFLTPAEANSAYSLTGHTHTFASLTGKPTTLAGYGITDAEPALGNPSVSGYVLSSTTAGVRSWIAPATGGSGTPGGSTTQVQFNDAGAFGGDNTFTWDKTNDKLSLGSATGPIAGWVTSAGTELVMEQTGDSFGTTRLRIQNRAGSAGPIFQNAALDLIDLGFKPLTGPQALIRMEHRSGSQMDGTNNTAGEFHIVEDSTAGVYFSHIFGQSRSYLGGITVIGPTATIGANSITIDTAISRNAAGVVEINNGTAGTYRNLIAQKITAWTGGQGFYVWGGAGFGSDSINMIVYDYAGNAVAGWRDNGVGLEFNSAYKLVWGSGAYNSTPDVGLSRNASGVVEINNGTAGQYRDLTLSGLTATNTITAQGSSIALSWLYHQGVHLAAGFGVGFSQYFAVPAPCDVAIFRTSAGIIKVTDGGAGTGIITGNGTVPPGGTTGQVLAKNSGTNYDVGWAAPATGGSGSPGGSNTQLQFNNSSAFGGATITYASDSLTFPGSTFNGIILATGYAVRYGANDVRIFSGGLDHWSFASNSTTKTIAGEIWGWTGSGTDPGNALDTALARNAAGVVEINNGTAGTYRDLKLRSAYSGGSDYQGFFVSSTDGMMKYTNSLRFQADFGTVIGLWNSSSLSVALAGKFGWADVGSGSSPDTALSRNAAGVVEINNGTAGTYRDLICRKVTARIAPRVTSVTSGATLSPNVDTDGFYAVSALAVAITTISAPAGTPVDFDRIVFRVTSDSSAHAVSGWDAIYRFSTAFPAPSNVAANSTNTWGFQYNATAAKWDCLAQTVNP